MRSRVHSPTPHHGRPLVAGAGVIATGTSFTAGSSRCRSGIRGTGSLKRSDLVGVGSIADRDCAEQDSLRAEAEHNGSALGHRGKVCDGEDVIGGVLQARGTAVLLPRGRHGRLPVLAQQLREHL